MVPAAASSASWSTEANGLRTLLSRLVTAAIGIPLLLALDAAGGWPFGFLVSAAALLACWELAGLMRASEFTAPTTLLFVACPALAVAPTWASSPSSAWVIGLLVVLALSGAYYMRRSLPSQVLLGLALALWVSVYVGILLGHLVALRHLHGGGRWVLLTLLMTWAFDTGAYVAGSTRGRTPFMQHISPRKTREGVAGGSLLCTAAAVMGVPLLGLHLWQAVLLGPLIAVAAQAGDLTESMIKRGSGVKDSGFLVPGQGGVLDRIDSLLFPAPIAYYAALLLGHAT